MTITVDSAVAEAPFGAAHARLLALVGAVILLDGFDLQLAAFAAPALRAEWGLEAKALGPAMAASLFGMAIGTGIGGAIADRIGRRPALILSSLWFGIATLFATASSGITGFAALRFLTGLGLGAALPGAAALIAEQIPARWRDHAMTMVIVGSPVGGMCGAALAAWLISAYGWRSCFAVGGALPLLLAAIFGFALVESTAWRGRRGADIQRARDDDSRVYAGPWRRSAIGLGIAFCAAMATLYGWLSWLPVMLTAAGFPLGSAIRGALVFNLCGVVAAFVAARITARFGSRATLIGAALITLAASIGYALAWHGGTAPAALLALVGSVGAGAFALQVGLYGLAARVFPVGCRAAGIGFSASIGRAGAIAAALGGGALLAVLPGGAAFTAAIALALLLAVAGILIVDRHAPAAARA